MMGASMRCPVRAALRALAIVAAVLLVLLPGGAVRAHSLGLSRGTYVVRGRTVEVELVFARAEPVDLAQALRDVEVSADGAPCAPLRTSEPELTEGDGLLARGTFACDGPPESLAVDVPVLARMPPGHAHLARLEWDALRRDVLLGPASHVLRASRGEVRQRTALGLVGMGAMHVLSGWDHLAFLFGLLLLPQTFRSIAKTVTAFTAAHSLTLALAVLGLVTPSARVVEPIIAASIAWVGVENLASFRRGPKDGRRRAERRWLVTLPFGLVHGFGFAGALAELGLARHDLPRALLSFNVGVELGQILVVAPLLPALALLRRARASERALRLVSGALVAVGVVVAILRAAGV
jgi:hydrogenase/urease accessory protein HupE